MRRLSVPPLLLSVLLTAILARAETVERVIAKVNGQVITLSEFQARQLEAAQAARIEASNVGAFLRQQNSRILQGAIDEILLLQKAEDAGISAPALYIDEVIANIRKENNLASQQELEALLAREGQSYADLRRIIERRVLRDLIIRRDIEPKLTVTDADLRAEYEKRRASDYTTPAKITLQEIVVPEDAGEAFAEQLAARARSGEDFAVLARAHSTAATRAHGGEVGEIAENDMDAELRKKVLALPVGGISQPMRTAGGYRIVKVAARTAVVTTPFETAREALRERVMMSRFEKEYDAYLEELRKSAQIELRVREVPLQLTGPIPEGSLLEGLDTGVADPPASTEPAAPAGAAPAGVGDDEIVTTPQAAPERIAPLTPPGSSAPAAVPAAEKPKGDSPGQ